MLEPLDDPDQGREAPVSSDLVKQIAGDIVVQMKEAERTGIAKSTCPKCNTIFRVLNESRFYPCPCGYYWGFPPKAVQDIIDERDWLRLQRERDALLQTLEGAIDLLGKTRTTLRTVIKWVKDHKAHDSLKPGEHQSAQR